jgi:3-oxoacyl-[acyl-carrier-protein] synthase II
MGRADNDVAIVGMACRVAGADDWQHWWQRLLKGERAIRAVPRGRLAGLETGPAYAALLDDIQGFDARFFGLSRRMATWMDPQQRILLELSWHALEGAGIPPRSLHGRPVAVFAANWVSEYRERMARAGAIDGTAAIGTLASFLANRLSYHYGLTGPSLSVDTACSAGLTAFALAVRGIQHGDFPMALVGAVNVLCGNFVSATGYRSGLLSRTGRSVPFDEDADGYIRGEGGACVLLKRLTDAMADGDPILAVVRGVAMNHDGSAGGLTGPDADSHAGLITDAITRAGVEVATVGYLEAHGPGTSTGDPVEMRGLRQAISADGMPATMAGPDGVLWVGSAKGNIGHLEAAAGLVGVVKAVLTLREKRIIGIPGLERVNSRIDLAGAPVRIADRDVPWPDTGAPRRACVSSFGLGGSNAHAVIEEAGPDPRSRVLPDRTYAFPLSASTTGGLRLLARDLAVAIAADDSLHLPAVAWTLQTGRTVMPVRDVVLAGDRAELCAALTDVAEGRTPMWPRPDARVAALDLTRWRDGGPVDWAAAWAPGTPPRRVPLPGHPFAREPYWFDDRPLDEEAL